MEQWMGEKISDNIGEQLWLMLISLLAGLVIALLFDLFRGWRRMNSICFQKGYKKKKSNWLVHIQDVLFWIVYIFITYVIFYRYNNGAPAGYVFLGEIAGIGIYYHFLHNWGRCFFTCTIWEIYTIITCFLKIILLPFRIICGNLFRLLKSFAKSVRIIIINN